VEVEETHISITGGWIEPLEVEGRFIEIIAPGDSPEFAETLAYTVLGFLALCIGDHAVGDVLFSEAYEASKGKQIGALRIPVAARFPRQAQDEELDMVHTSLPLLLGEDRSKRARALALRWYERAIRASTPLDKLLSCITGIETIVNAYAADHGPIPESIERRQKFNILLQSLSSEFDSETLSMVSQRLVDPTLTERFRFYVVQHGWDESLVEQFRHVVRLRNKAPHGDPVDMGEGQAGQARSLLARLLKSELALPAELPGEQIPHVYSTVLRYELLGARRDELGNS
jgi:hypothetical protein